ncbi:MAG: hypothetical protein IJL26_00280 [Clostridia bacterium]|nr:hypothetical protein [Clostridia bacterium]
MKQLLKTVGTRKFGVLALAVFFLLAGFLALSVFYAEVIFDEFYYYTVAQRFFAGDRLLVDEWQVTQLSALVLLPVYRIFTAITGGTEGLVLFGRLVFLAEDLALYWFLVFLFRKKTAAAPIAAGLFCADLYAGIVTLNYYNLSMHALAVSALLLFLPEKAPSAKRVLSAGFVFGCAVIFEPGFLVAYLFYSLIALACALRNGKGTASASVPCSPFGGGTWLLFSAGGAACALLLMLFLQFTSGFGEIVKALPELLSDGEYGIRWYGHENTGEKLAAVGAGFGLPGLIAPFLLLPAALLAGKIGRKHGKNGPTAAVFLLALCFLAVSFGVAAIGAEYTVFQCSEYPLAVFTLVCFLLCRKKDRRVFALWLTAAVCSAAADFTSSTSLFFAFRLAYFPAVFFAVRVFRELAAAHTSAGRKNGRLSRSLLSAATGSLALLTLIGVSIMLFHITNYSFASKTGRNGVVAASGPEKGLVTMRSLEQTRSAKRADLDYIGETCGGAFYVAKRLPDCYLYLNELPMAAYSACYVPEDTAVRQARYWQLHPEKRPEYIYVPYNEDKTLPEELSPLLALCEYKSARGKNGYIIKVTEWKSFPAEE